MKLRYKSFSLIELIFAILIIAIISSIGISKLSYNNTNAIILKGKNDLNIILYALKKYKTNLILNNLPNDLDSLEIDSNKTYLFSKILKHPFISKIDKGGWEKISDTKYRYYVSTNQSVVFRFDKTNFTFRCNKKNQLCQELIK